MTDLPAPVVGRPDPDLRPLLDAELDRLPDKYRAPIVLCHLEGHTLDEAARILGWPKGTVAGRLSRGRDQLRARLARRGVAVTAPGLERSLASRAPALALPEPLVHAAVHATLDGQASAAAAALADAVLADLTRKAGSLLLLGITAALMLLGSGTLVAAGVNYAIYGGGCHR
jgi:hypothetical protein